MPKVKRTNNQPARLQDALVLFKYLLWQFRCTDMEALSRDLKDPALEGVDDEGVSKLYHAMQARMYHDTIGPDKLLEYDRNIVRHTNEINENRMEKIQWKYFQYLSLLFTEIYLDRFFTDKAKLLEDISDFLRNDFNFRPETYHGITEFTQKSSFISN